MAVLLAALFAVAHPFLNDIEDFSPYRKLYSRVSELPKGAIIAAAPDSWVAGGIPLYSSRRIFYNPGVSNTLSMAHSGLDRPAAAGLMRALCSEDPDAAASFARENGIDYFLVESGFYGLRGLAAGEGRPSTRPPSQGPTSSG